MFRRPEEAAAPRGAPQTSPMNGRLPHRRLAAAIAWALGLLFAWPAAAASLEEVEAEPGRAHGRARDAAGAADRPAYGPRQPSTVICEPAAWPLPVDGGLCDAARLLALRLSEQTAEERPGGTASIASWHAKMALHEAGVADPHVRARRIEAGSYNELFARMEAAVADLAAEVSVIGMAMAPAPAGDPTGVVMGARRLVHIEPFPAVVERGESVRLRGRTAAGTHAPSAFLGTEGEAVRRLPIDRSGDSFTVTTGPLPEGRNTIEILVEAGEGPEVALLAHVLSGESTRAMPEPLEGAVERPVAWLHQKLADHRAHLGLEIARRDPDLDRLAAERAEAIATRGRPVHRSAPNQDAATRLAELGYPFAWAAENLATGPEAPDAFLALLESPAHRLIIEHDRARRVGVGLHVAHGRAWLAVLVAEAMEARAALPFATAERVVESRLIHRAEDALREGRRKRGLRHPSRDPALDDLARELARHLALRDLPSDAAAQTRARQMALATCADASSVSVEIVIGGRPEDLIMAPALMEDDCERIGVGVAPRRSERFGGERLWMASICLRREGAR